MADVAAAAVAAVAAAAVVVLACLEVWSCLVVVISGVGTNLEPKLSSVRLRHTSGTTIEKKNITIITIILLK